MNEVPNPTSAMLTPNSMVVGYQYGDDGIPDEVKILKLDGIATIEPLVKAR